MTDIAATLQSAVRQHQAGQFAAAEADYRRILSVAPQHTDALHLLGLVCHQSGRAAEAIDFITRALATNPNYAEAHYNLGKALQDAGRLPEAVASYERAVALKPAMAEAWFNLGNARRDLARFEDAATAFRAALRARPNYAKALTNLGSVLTDLHRDEEAVAVLQQAQTLQPTNPRIPNNLGNALRNLGRLDDAKAAFRRAIELEPLGAEAHNNLGTAHMDAREYDAALASFRRALELKPDYAKAHGNVGAVLLDRNELDAARASFEEQFRLQPNTPASHQALGAVLMDSGHVTEALGHFRQAVSLDAEHAESWLCLAMAELLQGRLESGFALSEWRWKCKGWTKRTFREPLWRGEPLPGRTLFLHAEQGLGDTLQFVRYARLAKERSQATVCLECPGVLVPLLSRCPWIDRPIGTSPLPPFDVQAPLMSLPWIFGTTLETIPAEVPYVFPDPDRQARWRERLAEMPGFRVGITWQGNPNQRKDRRRSTTLDRFESLARVPGVTLISLQKGAGAEQIAAVADRFTVRTLGDDVDADGAFVDTAAILTQLDLVVATDTAIPHLAGALGVPTWLLLSYVADWRWLEQRPDCPWYPSMRLFRQPRPNDWDAVFRSVAEELQRLQAEFV